MDEAWPRDHDDVATRHYSPRKVRQSGKVLQGFMVTPSLKAAIEHLAAYRQVSQSHVNRTALRDYIGRVEEGDLREEVGKP